MAGAKSFGIGRIGGGTVYVNGVNVGNINEIGDAGVLDGLTTPVTIPDQQDTRFLATAALLYGSDFNDPTQIALLPAVGEQEANQFTSRLLAVLSRPQVFADSGWKRAAMAAFAAMEAYNTDGVAMTTHPGNWVQYNSPGLDTQAVTTRAAPGAGRGHVITSIDASLIIPPGVNQPILTLDLIDDVGGSNLVLWTKAFGFDAVSAAGAMQSVSLSGLNIVCGTNSSITLQFSAAGATGTFQTVAMTGYTPSA